MQPQTLVPPGRLGTLLIEHRNRHGLNVADLAVRTNRFTARELEAAERGGVSLSDDAVDALMELYGVDLQTGTYGRSELVIDMTANTIGVGATSLSFDGPTRDLVLERYVSLLYLLREQPVGVKLPLRDNDLDTLGTALDQPQRLLISDLHAIMDDRRTVERTRRMGRRRRVLQAGLLVGATMAGALIMVGDHIVPSAAALDSTLDAPTHLPSQRGQAVTASLDLDLSHVLPGWSIDFEGADAKYGGMTYSSARAITVHVNPEWSDDQVAGVLMHEAGHAIDLEYLDDSMRHQWMQLRGIDTTWWTGDGMEDFAFGAGDFAEAVAAVTTGLGTDDSNDHGGHTHKSRSHFGDFTDEQLDFVRVVLTNAQQTTGAQSA